MWEVRGESGAYQDGELLVVGARFLMRHKRKKRLHCAFHVTYSSITKYSVILKTNNVFLTQQWNLFFFHVTLLFYLILIFLSLTLTSLSHNFIQKLKISWGKLVLTIFLLLVLKV